MKKLFIILAIVALSWGVAGAETYTVEPLKISPAEHIWTFTPDEVKSILIDYIAKKGINIPKGESTIYGLEYPRWGDDKSKVIITIKEATE